MTSGVRGLRAGEFLVCYDYGMGGLWGVLIAPSVDAVNEKYPELVVVQEQPKWLSDDDVAEYRSRALWLEDEPPQGLLRVLVSDRDQRGQ